MMKISIGADHRGLQLKSKIMEHFTSLDWDDVGTHSADRTDYPVYAQRVSEKILSFDADLGILICGSGVGICIAANRFKGVYAALCWNAEIAKKAKEHDGANVLVLPSDFISTEVAFEIVTAWLRAEFKGGLYQQRLDMIDAV